MGVKKKHEAFAWIAAIHGIGHRLSHEEMVGLWLSRPESEVRVANIIRIGHTAAHTELPRAWFEATTDTADEAKLQYDLHLQRRAEANR